MKVSVITPTCDRPVGFALAERWMARQTRQPDEWIIADGGQTPAVCQQGQVHLWLTFPLQGHGPAPPGPQNLADNLLVGLDAATGDVIVFWEDDDWYAPTHLEQLVAQLEQPDVWAAGDDTQRYYNLQFAVWRTFPNRGACLCQTGIQRAVIPTLQHVIHRCRQSESYGIDGRFWEAIPRRHWNLQPTLTCLGMKGLPGQPGLGIGHRPTLRDRRWKADPGHAQLRAWIGDADAEIYLTL